MKMSFKFQDPILNAWSLDLYVRWQIFDVTLPIRTNQNYYKLNWILFWNFLCITFFIYSYLYLFAVINVCSIFKYNGPQWYSWKVSRVNYMHECSFWCLYYFCFAGYLGILYNLILFEGTLLCHNNTVSSFKIKSFYTRAL